MLRNDNRYLVIGTLSELQLSHNKLQNVDEYAFAGLRNLRQLTMKNNRLEALKKHTFTGLHRLTRLDLSNNQLKEIDEETFDALPGLSALEMFGTKMRCTCSYVDMLRSLNLEWMQADCHNDNNRVDLHTSWKDVQVPSMPRPATHVFNSWEVWSDCESGECGSGPYMRTAACQSCNDTASPLCVNHSTDGCVIVAFKRNTGSPPEGGSGGDVCRSLGCNVTGKCRKIRESASSCHSQGMTFSLISWIVAVLLIFKQGTS